VGVVPADLSAALDAARAKSSAASASVAAPASRGATDPATPKAASPDGTLAGLSAPGAAGRAAGGPPLPAPLHAQTALGVAIPGIAPLHPGVSSTPVSPARAEGRPVPDATRLEPSASTPPSLVVPARLQLPRGALVLLASGVVLAGAALAFAFLWSSSRTLSASVGSDDSGRERIDLVCEDCPDGTRISFGSASAQVSNLMAHLTPPEPLPLGSNTLAFRIERPGSRPQSVTTTLPPLEYRVRPDTSTLSGDEPRLSLRIEALPGSQVKIGREPVSLDERGLGVGKLDISEKLRGPKGEVESFEQAVDYAIEVPSGRHYEGQLSLRLSVTPLVLEAPGRDTVTDLERFMLAGRAAKGATVWVAGNAIAVDAEGRFAQLMSIDSVGVTEVTVRSSHEGLAPRFETFRLERVANLASRAKQLAREAQPLEKIIGDVSGNVGQLVQASGKIVEIKADGRRTLILVAHDAACARAQCLLRLGYGGLKKLERGARLSAIGRLTGTVPGREGEDVPDIDVTLLQ
jgi:hypothetical protein